MNHALVIAGREFREKSRLFVMAAVLATAPYLALLLPSARNDRTTVLMVVGGFLAVVVAWGTAAVQGASTIGRPLTEKRLSFYFARPVSPLAIWAGKAAASIAVSLLCFAIVAVPSLLGILGRWVFDPHDTKEAVAVVVLGMLALFFFSHAVSTMLRSRSALIAFDFLCAALSAGAIYFIVRPVVLGAGAGLLWTLAPIGAGLLIAFAVAPVWQLARGRTDVRRSHVALSRALWTGVAIVLALAGASMLWLTSTSPSSLDHFTDLTQSPNGPWVVVTGWSKARFQFPSTFVVNADTGDYQRMVSPTWWGGARFSRNARVMVWIQPHSIFSDKTLEIHTRRLDDDAKVIATGIRVEPVPVLALSDDGTRLAVGARQLISVYELASGKLLASVRGASPLGATEMLFVTPDVVRFYESGTYQRESARLRVFELDVPARKLTQTGDVLYANGWSSLSLSGDATHMFVRGPGVIADARTGIEIATLPGSPDNRISSAMMLDGTTITCTRENGVLHLRRYTREGEPQFDLPLPGVAQARITGQLGERRLLLRAFERWVPGMSVRSRRMIVVDVTRGAIERVIPGLEGPASPFGGGPYTHRIDDNRPFAAVDGNGVLILYDPHTGERKPFPG